MRTRLPWIVWAIALVVAVTGAVAMMVAMWPALVALPWVIGFTLIALGAATTGAIVARRLPGNAVGWLLLGLGVGTSILLLMFGYTETVVDERPPPTALVYTTWVSNWMTVPVLYGTTAFLLFLFPDGHLPSRRWRWAARFAAVAVSMATLASTVWPAKLDFGIDNPFAPDGAATGFVRTFYIVTDWLAPPVMSLAIAALVVRLRRSRGVERQQLKWFAYTTAFAAIGLTAGVIGPQVVSDIGFALGLLALVGLPITIGMAILRYRLYAIDVVINRTLVYGTLTVALGAAYLAGVLLFQLALSPLTKESGLAIAASTLAVAALFRPARAKIQGLVDRRFYRHRYDARRTLDEFGVRLRHELDLETLAADLRGVVHDTMQPAHVSLWLRRTDRNDSRTAPL